VLTRLLSGEIRHVLIVEDEPLLLLMAMDLVEEAGFSYLTANNADEALHILEGRPTICLLFTDIDMPLGSMNGLGLAFRVRNRWPPIELIVTSGHTTIKSSDLPERGRFFQKPYDAAEIIGVMRSMLITDSRLC